MANLTARFKMVDDISSKLDAVADAGDQMVDSLEEIEDASEAAFGSMKSGASGTASSIQGVATSATSTSQAGAAMGAAIADAAADAAAQAGKLGEETEQVGEESEEAGKKGQEAIEALEAALQAAGVAMAIKEITDAFAECSEAAAEVETAAAKVSTIADTTQVSLSRITDGTVDLSNRTGQAATELLDSVYNSISAGVQTADAVAFVEKANQLAVGGFTNATTAVDVLTTALNAYGLSVGQVSQISDYLITTQNLGKTTVDELADSVGRVIPLAAAYGVQMDNLSTAYAVMTANGIATNETGTYLKSILSELGDTASVVSNTLVNETGSSFAQLTKEGYSLGDVLSILGDSVNGDATAFANLWGSTEAGVGALSLFNSGAERYNQVLGQMQNSAGATAAAYNTMADTTETAHNRMTAASDNLQVAIGSALNPTIADAYNGIADLTGGLAEFAAQHPTAVKAITAITAGLGAAAVAVTAFMTIKKAIPIIQSLGVAMNTALGPMGWVAIGITGVVTAGAAMIAMMSDAEDETLSYTATTRRQAAELSDLQAAYEKACDTYGETSEEASRLKYQMDDLSESFESNKQTVAEFSEECQAVVDSHDSMMQSFEDSRDSIEDSEVNTFALIQKLSDLADGTYQTADSQGAMKAIIDELNGSVAGLDLTYDALIADQDAAIDGVKRMAQAEAERQKQQAMYDEYVQLIQDQAKLQEQLAVATDEATAAQWRFNTANAEWQSDLNKWGDLGPVAALFTGSAAAWDAAKENVDAATEAQGDLQGALDETNARILEIEQSWGLAGDATQENEEATISWEEASTQAMQSVQDEMQTLIEEYQEVYNAALSSFEGQFGLFDQASTESEEYMNATVANAQEALNSQLYYWENYKSNIETLSSYTAEQLGLTQEAYDHMMSYVQDGSEQAAGLAASMVENLQSGNTEAVTTMGQTLAEVQATKASIAETTAEWVTDFSGQMAELVATMESTIDSMNLSGEASAAASATISAYAASISAGKGAAVSAAQQIASAVSAALASANATINVGVSGTIPGHASGTTNAEDVFVAGENGPELIVDHEGSTVFPTSETARIVDAVNNAENVTSVAFSDEFVEALDRYTARRGTVGSYIEPPASVRGGAGEIRNTPAQDKTIRLEIAGTGSMNVNSGTSKDDVVEFMYSNLRPILLNIVHEEIFEEGDGHYDF